MACVEIFGEPSGGAPVGAAGMDDGEERLRNRVEAGFADLLGEFFVAFEGVEEGLVMDAELGSGLAEGEAVGHETEEAAFGEVVEFCRAAAAEGAGGEGGGEWGTRGRGDREIFAGGGGGVANYSGVGIRDRSAGFVGGDRHNENVVRGLWRLLGGRE